MFLYIARHAWAGESGDPRWPDDSLRPLTPEGIEKIDMIVAVAHRHQQEALSELSPEEVAQFRAIVAKIEQNIDFHQ